MLLSKTHAGYLNLTRLVSRTYTEGQHRGLPVLERSWLDGHADGLIALSGGRAGDIGQALVANKTDHAVRLLDEWRRLFPDSFYLELQRTGRARDEEYLHRAVSLAGSAAVPVVATIKEFVSYLYAKVVDRDPFATGDRTRDGDGKPMAATDAS